jgi:hypothetical protein
MAQQLSGGMDDRTYRGPYLFYPQTPLDPIGCPDCDTPSIFVPDRRERPHQISLPKPVPSKFQPNGMLKDDGIHEKDGDSDEPIDVDESGGDTIDNGLPKAENSKTIDELIQSISDVGASRKEDGILEDSPESSGFTILNKDSFENSISLNELGNVLVFLNDDDFQTIVNGDLSKTLSKFDSSVAINKNFIMIGWKVNTNCSMLPCIDSETMTKIKTEKYGETVLPDNFINMMMLVFGTRLSKLGHAVSLQGVDSSIERTTTMEDAMKIVANNHELFHVKKNN